MGGRQEYPRRRVLITGAAVAAAGTATACAPGGEQGSDLTDAPPEPAPAPPDGTPLAQLSDVPVGGATSAQTPDGQALLVTQPQQGVVEALSAICTHEGCTVVPQDEQLECPCHGSVFDLGGNVLNGPADQPLDRVDVHVADDQVISGPA